MDTKWSLEQFKLIIMGYLDQYANSLPMMEPIAERYLHYPLKYECSLVSKNGGAPTWEIWNHKCYGYWVYAHLYKNGFTGRPIAQSVLGFKEFQFWAGTSVIACGRSIKWCCASSIDDPTKAENLVQVFVYGPIYAASKGFIWCPLLRWVVFPGTKNPVTGLCEFLWLKKMVRIESKSVASTIYHNFKLL